MDVEVPENILLILKCSKCEVLLSRGPVYLCAEGQGLCSACHSAEPSVPAIRNTHYEAAANLLLFPCKNQTEGCVVKLPFSDPSGHEEACEKRQYVCPVLGSSACDWFGPAALIQDHCQQQHPDRVLDNPATLTHDITKPSSHTFLLRAFQLLFLLFTKVCVKTGNIYYCIRYLGSSSEVDNFKYSVTIMRNDEMITTKRQVAPQGCLAIQEDSSLIFNINSLLNILIGFNDTTFTVSLERIMTAEKCCKCGILITVIEYRDLEGWKCLSCAPDKICCKNSTQGCTFKGFSGKCIKHQQYFCKYAKYCYNCETGINDQYLTHFEKSHDKCFNGSVWRAKERKKNRYIIQTDAGTGACTYLWTESYFRLFIYTPQPSDKLANFNCTVKVTLVATGQHRIYSPDVCYDNTYDWFLEVMKDDFSDWSDVFDVCVTIKKIK